MSDDACVFKFRYGTDCDPAKPCLHSTGTARIYSIINASKVYGDNLNIELEEKLEHNENLTIPYHKNCVSRYTSKSNLARHTRPEDEDRPAKKLRRSLKPFDFLLHCIYCGEPCALQKDSKNPDRWRQAYMCRSTESELEGKPYKQFLLEICDSRNDQWADDVRVRIEGARFYLPAVEARYHKDCMSRFRQQRGCKSGDYEHTTPEKFENDEALQHVVNVLAEDKSLIWNSIELFNEYHNHSGNVETRTGLIKALRSHFEDIVVLSSPGYANIITFRDNTASVMKVVKANEDDDVDQNISNVAKHVLKDINAIKCDKVSYSRHIDKNKAAESLSNTLQALLSAVSPKLDNTLPALMIGNIVTSVVKKQSTDLQVALGILLRDSKTIINHMYDYRVTCSYNEVLRFKKSAAVATIIDPTQQGISESSHGLVQVIADNFDADISSPNVIP